MRLQALAYNQWLRQELELEIQVWMVDSTYYKNCMQADRHIRGTRNDLWLEKAVKTMDWSVRVYMTLLGNIVVDSWLLYKHCTNSLLTANQNQFYLDHAKRTDGEQTWTAKVQSRENVSESTPENSLSADTGLCLRITDKKP